MKKLIFVTGASGTGKTTAIKALEEKGVPGVIFRYFDSIGVPSGEEMIAKYGSLEGWQKHETLNWVERIKNNYLSQAAVVLDGQIRQTFIDEACRAAGVDNYKIIVFVCDDEARDKRLIARGHKELANQDMSNWNKYLKDQAVSRGNATIDTTKYELGQAAGDLEKLIST